MRRLSVVLSVLGAYWSPCLILSIKIIIPTLVVGHPVIFLYTIEGSLIIHWRPSFSKKKSSNYFLSIPKDFNAYSSLNCGHSDIFVSCKHLIDKLCKFVWFFKKIYQLHNKLNMISIYTERKDFWVSTFQTLLGGVWWRLSIIFLDSIVFRLRSKVRNMPYVYKVSNMSKYVRAVKNTARRECSVGRENSGAYTLMFVEKSGKTKLSASAMQW